MTWKSFTRHSFSKPWVYILTQHCENSLLFGRRFENGLNSPTDTRIIQNIDWSEFDQSTATYARSPDENFFLSQVSCRSFELLGNIHWTALLQSSTSLWEGRDDGWWPTCAGLHWMGPTTHIWAMYGDPCGSGPWECTCKKKQVNHHSSCDFPLHRI